MKFKLTRSQTIALIGAALIGVTLILSGCSTISGLAKDLGDMSEATRSAMSEK